MSLTFEPGAKTPDVANRANTSNKVGIIDADVHPSMNPVVPAVLKHMPKRWQDYVRQVGPMHGGSSGGERPRHREYASRWDAEPPEGGAPGSSPQFAAQQLLDKYDMSGAILNDIGGFRMAGAGRQPAELSIAFCRAINESRRENWLAVDPRWYAAINLPYELPEAGAAEIRHCKEEMGEYGDRWKTVLMAPDNLRPAGHPSYWPIYEACEHYDLPVGFHVLASHRITPSGPANYYFEEHCDFAGFNFPVVSSFVYEGVFDRFPKLKIVMVELGWSWAVPLAWRLDHAFRVMGNEVSHLQRLPSEYIRDHFWYTTQPMEEPEKDEWFDEVLEVYEASGMGDKVLFSSDYPHWDFDEPDLFIGNRDEAQCRRLLGENARDLYHIDFIPGSGLERR
jgi:predicted TIM-barrel fold metal-dependent hydrolase